MRKIIKISLTILTIIIVAIVAILVSDYIVYNANQTEKVENYLVEKYGLDPSEIKIGLSQPRRLLANCEYTVVKAPEVNGTMVEFWVIDNRNSNKMYDNYFDQCLRAFVKWKIKQITQDVGFGDVDVKVHAKWSRYLESDETKYDNEYMLSELNRFETRYEGYSAFLYFYCDEVDEALAQKIYEVINEINEEMYPPDHLSFWFYTPKKANLFGYRNVTKLIFMENRLQKTETATFDIEKGEAYTEDEFCDRLLELTQ